MVMGEYQFLKIDTISIFLTKNIGNTDNTGSIFLFLVSVPNVHFPFDFWKTKQKLRSALFRQFSYNFDFSIFSARSYAYA